MFSRVTCVTVYCTRLASCEESLSKSHQCLFVVKNKLLPIANPLLDLYQDLELLQTAGYFSVGKHTYSKRPLLYIYIVLQIHTSVSDVNGVFKITLCLHLFEVCQLIKRRHIIKEVLPLRKDHLEDLNWLKHSTISTSSTQLELNAMRYSTILSLVK